MTFLASPLSELSSEEVSVASLPEALQNWIKSVYRGCSPFFDLPEKVSFRMVRSVLRWKAIDEERRPLEDKWGERLADDFQRWGRAVGRAYTRTERIGDTLDVADDLIRIQFRNELALLWVEVGKKFHRIASDEILGKAISDDFTELETLDDAEFQAYVSRSVAQKVTRVASSTKAAIAQVIERGLRDGASIRDIVEKLQTGLAFGRHRGFLIARTEVIGASNGATHFAYGKHLDRATTEKEWLATRDGRVRATHSVANGQRVAFTEYFSVGAAQLMFPADTESGGGHPEEVINCRCTVLYHSTATTNPARRTPRRRRRPGAPVSPAQAAAEELTAASVRRKVIDELEDIGREVKALEDLRDQVRKRQVVLLKERAEGSFWDSTQRADWRVRYDVLGNEILDIDGKQIKKLNKKKQKAFLDAWNPSGKKSTVIDFENSNIYRRKRPVSTAKLKEAKAFLEQLGGIEGVDAMKVGTKTLKKGKRAFQNNAIFTQPDGGKKLKTFINIAPDDGVNVVIHETGHSMETLSKTQSDKVDAFLKRRTAGEPLEKLSDVTGIKGYGSTEVTKKDKFINAYQGRVYPFRAANGNVASEVTSMGVQMLYEDPYKVATQDADLFDFLWDLFGKPAP